MANPQIHVRSISLPSRLNPTDFEVELQKVKSCHISSDFPITSEAIQSGLVGLSQLYNSVQSLTAQQSIVFQDAKSMEESLSGSVELLDSCSIIRELFQMIKEKVQSLQSALRRKGLSDPSIHSDITTYFCFRKKMSKGVAKTLKTLKNLEHRIASDHSVNVESNFTSVLRQVTGITIAIFKSILVFLSLPVGFPKGWSFVSKLMLTKSVATSGEENEVVNVDSALRTIQGQLRSTGAKVVDEVQMLQKTLQNVAATVQGFEEGLERLNRKLVQTRVILLNIITHH
ncbi:hypothetical protein CDL12_07901 [Handroanthus impetiginosus]|uniref:Uncharacterized protein n=1 Tax=Handroanthus impetiginosus TaxID=429701 RepID=A0A2G9HPQ3_9LAMI|nr:hypothetical protein CDL12_07901 [Handroanthus impetiginosus]